ncbi:ParB/RepB/Spo0J family partition protein [Porphyromonadaceae bacterium]
MDADIVMRQPQIVRMDMLFANDYNPNRMPREEMRLLGECISKYGFLFPIIVSWDSDKQKYRIIDGYHRFETLKRLGAKEVSVIDLQLPYHDCVQLTVLMNRIKGLHQVEKMSDLIVKLENLGLEDSEICSNLGMEAEEFLRLKQQLGIAHAFRDVEYANSWEISK